ISQYLQYSIFFQLERAYILQVLLHVQPDLDPVESFHPSQTTYAGLPPLPCRYASLNLSYDWHLPGKEQRRKRRHRKSHGAIGSHELTTRIANAWRNVDEDIRQFCSRVCRMGLRKYNDEMKEWKETHGKNDSSETMTVDMTTSTRAPVAISNKKSKTKDPEEVATSSRHTKTLQESTQVVKVPSSYFLSREGMDQTLKLNSRHVLVDLGDEDILGMWAQEELSRAPAPELASSTDTVLSSNAISDQEFVNAKGNREETGLEVRSQGPALRKSSVDSNVDIEDDMIINMFMRNNCDETVDDSNHMNCCNYTPGYKSIASSSTTTSATQGQGHIMSNGKSDLQHHSMFGTKGCTQTLQDLKRTKLELEQQQAKMEQRMVRARSA
ncbi:hypothetical protein ACHAXR_003459, partial [Thalassiosira sp. AJA248-18]